MFGKIAFGNVKRQFSSYIIYFITVVFTVALMFAVNNILFSDALLLHLRPKDSQVNRADAMPTLYYMVFLITLVVGFIICYATGFLLRKRKKEFGTYMLLGIRRGSVTGIFVLENLIIGSVSFVVGCVLGLGIFQILNVIVVAAMGNNFQPLGYDFDSIWATLLQWTAVFTAAVLYAVFILSRSKISDLVKEKPATEKKYRTQAKKKVQQRVRFYITLAVVLISFAFLLYLSLEMFNAFKRPEARYDNYWRDYIFGIPLSFAVLVAALFVLPKSQKNERYFAFGALVMLIAAVGFGLWFAAEAFNVFGREKPLFDYMLTGVDTGVAASALFPTGVILISSAIFMFYYCARGFYTRKLQSDKRLKGGNVFYYRQMSSALGRNAGTMGTIALLLAFSLIFTSFAFSQRAAAVEDVKASFIFDVHGSWAVNDTYNHNVGSPAEVRAEAKKYSEISFVYEFDLYSVNKYDTPYEERVSYFGDNGLKRGITPAIIKESDFNTYLRAIKEPETALNSGGFMFYYHYDRSTINGVPFGYANIIVPNANDKITLYGNEITMQGEMRDGYPKGFYSFGMHNGLLVVKDELMPASGFSEFKSSVNLIMNTKDYLPPQFYHAFSMQKDGYFNSNIECKYFELDKINAEMSIIVISALYVGVVFMFIAMALLSLKIMSDADLDKKRYAILNMLGVSAGRQRKLLMRQLLLFYVAPMIIPIIMVVPAILLSAILSYWSFGTVSAAIFLTGFTVPCVYALVFIAYFGATYYLSVNYSIRPLESPGVKLLN